MKSGCLTRYKMNCVSLVASSGRHCLLLHNSPQR